MGQIKNDAKAAKTAPQAEGLKNSNGPNRFSKGKATLPCFIMSDVERFTVA